MTSARTRTRARAFTLVELIVTLLVIAAIAAIAVVAYSQVTARAETAAAQANLRQLTTAVTAQAALDGAPTLSRELVIEALADSSVTVVEGIEAAATWELFGPEYVPTSSTQFAVGFDTGAGSAVDRAAGTRLAVVTAASGRTYAQVIDLAAATQGQPVRVSTSATPLDVLGGTRPGNPSEPPTPAPTPTPEPTKDPTPALELPSGVGEVRTSGVTTTSATLSWAAADRATSYTVTNTVTGEQLTVSQPTAAITGAAGSSVQFRIVGVNASGEGAPATATVSFLAPQVGQLVYRTTAPGCLDTTIVVPAAGEVTGTIDWGDGTREPMSVRPTHTYAVAGQYSVSIEGSFTAFGAAAGQGGAADAPCLISVGSWQNTGATSLAFAFFGARNLVNVPAQMDTSEVTSMESMFANAGAFNQPLTLSTPKVTTMANMFSGATSFNQPLSMDTSKVTTMAGMFNNAGAFNQTLTFDTSAVTTMANMFRSATKFNQPLEFDTRSVTDMSYLFQGATSFNRPLAWDTSKVTRMLGTFYGATSFNQDLSRWKVSSSVVRTYFDQGATAWKLPRPQFV